MSVGQHNQQYGFSFLPTPPNVIDQSEYSILINSVSAFLDNFNLNLTIQNLVFNHTDLMIFK